MPCFIRPTMSCTSGKFALVTAAAGYHPLLSYVSAAFWRLAAIGHLLVLLRRGLLSGMGRYNIK